MKAAGTVRISMIIMPDGTVDDLVVLSTPNDDLAIAALMAVRLWRYSPAYLDGEASEANLTVDVNFDR
jgi:TonB family protein